MMNTGWGFFWFVVGGVAAGVVLTLLCVAVDELLYRRWRKKRGL